MSCQTKKLFWRQKEAFRWETDTMKGLEKEAFEGKILILFFSSAHPKIVLGTQWRRKGQTKGNGKSK